MKKRNEWRLKRSNKTKMGMQKPRTRNGEEDKKDITIRNHIDIFLQDGKLHSVGYLPNVYIAGVCWRSTEHWMLIWIIDCGLCQLRTINDLRETNKHENEEKKRGTCSSPARVSLFSLSLYLSTISIRDISYRISSSGFFYAALTQAENDHRM